MRILLDECLPRRLGALLHGHDVKTMPQMGWAGQRNGDLLRQAEAEFDAILTIDQSISSAEHQQASSLSGGASRNFESARRHKNSAPGNSRGNQDLHAGHGRSRFLTLPILLALISEV
ncbi:MAG TPA: DUF5615 family PIN-like protein [Phycisphaerae bacterium]|nr:DUF5615 family PIN-like protein [Phycisphaerae bacterium]